MATTEIATRPVSAVAAASAIALTPKGAVELRSIGEAMAFSGFLHSGGMLPEGVTPQSAAVSIVAGAGLGLSPLQSVQTIAVVNGRPTLYGDGLNAAVRRSGMLENEKVEKFRAADGHVVAVRVTVWRKGMKEPIVGEFSEKMARQAGLWGKQGPWTQYPDRMMFNRARAFAYRDGFADVLSGVRSTEEEEDAERARGAEPLPAAEVVEAEPAAAAGAVPLRRRRGRRTQASELFEEEQALAEPIPYGEQPQPEAAAEPEGTAGGQGGGEEAPAAAAAEPPADFL